MKLNLIKSFLFFNVFAIKSLNDAPFQGQLSFQDPASPVMEGIIYLHDYVWIFLTFILIFVIWMLVRIIILFKEDNNQIVNPIVANVPLEIIWTLTPALFLALIAGNSISHLYSSEELLNPALDIIVIGNQWYWTYEFMVFKNKVSLESHMIETNDLLLGECRNLEVDNSLVLPIETNIRILTTSTDVIHAWTIPSLGLKLDAFPGRINESSLYIKRLGKYFGQCSEICGKGHAVMPIALLAVTKEEYNIYLHLINLQENGDFSLSYSGLVEQL